MLVFVNVLHIFYINKYVYLYIHNTYTNVFTYAHIFVCISSLIWFSQQPSRVSGIILIPLYRRTKSWLSELAHNPLHLFAHCINKCYGVPSHSGPGAGEQRPLHLYFVSTQHLLIVIEFQPQSPGYPHCHRINVF